MKLLVLNGITDDVLYRDLEKQLESELVNNTTMDIEYFRLRDMSINYCSGCWSCWWKTPGRCSIKDDQEQILSRIPNVDRVLYISPVILGYESSILKTCKDRSIPIAHPYIRIHKGEMHHYPRYKRLPNIDVLLIKDENTIQEDIDLIEDAYKRMALNFDSRLGLFEAITTSGGEINVFDRI